LQLELQLATVASIGAPVAPRTKASLDWRSDRVRVRARLIGTGIGTGWRSGSDAHEFDPELVDAYLGYWTSTQQLSSTYNFVVQFLNGQPNREAWTATNRVRCVRP
jgi:hypothetical protein